MSHVLTVQIPFTQLSIMKSTSLIVIVTTLIDAVLQTFQKRDKDLLVLRTFMRPVLRVSIEMLPLCMISCNWVFSCGANAASWAEPLASGWCTEAFVGLNVLSVFSEWNTFLICTRIISHTSTFFFFYLSLKLIFIRCMREPVQGGELSYIEM